MGCCNSHDACFKMCIYLYKEQRLINDILLILHYNFWHLTEGFAIPFEPVFIGVKLNKVLTWSLVLPHKEFWRERNKWKSDDARSGKYRECSNISHPSSNTFWRGLNLACGLSSHDGTPLEFTISRRFCIIDSFRLFYCRQYIFELTVWFFHRSSKNTKSVKSHHAESILFLWSLSIFDIIWSGSAGRNYDRLRTTLLQMIHCALPIINRFEKRLFLSHLTSLTWL